LQSNLWFGLDKQLSTLVLNFIKIFLPAGSRFNQQQLWAEELPSGAGLLSGAPLLLMPAYLKAVQNYYLKPLLSINLYFVLMLFCLYEFKQISLRIKFGGIKVRFFDAVCLFWQYNKATLETRHTNPYLIPA
jgi:hypothetical protein